MNPIHPKEISDKTVEKVKTEEIPLCEKCLIEIDQGNYICNQCRINLCVIHAREHSSQFKDHKYTLLEK